MEHLILPHNPATINTRVPYVCDSQFSSDSFLAYAYDRGLTTERWDETAVQNFHAISPFFKKLSSLNTAELQSIYQTWFFFGLLKTFLGDKFDPAAFIETDAEGKLVTTTLLPSLVEDVVGRSKEHGSTGELPTRRDTVVALYVIYNTMNIVATPDEFDWRVRFSILSTCEFIIAALNGFPSGHAISATNADEGADLEAMLNHNEPIRVGRWAHLISPSERQNLMLGSCWCPSDVQRAGRFTTVQALMMAGRMQPAVQKDHRDCDENLCTAYQISLDDYQPRHICENSSCALVYIDNKQVVEALKNESLPLLKIHLNSSNLDDLYIEVVPSKPNSKYCALSHVWAGGLGNPKANALPRCQMSRLMGLISQLQNEEEDPSEPIYLWLDTLCCPVSPAEDKALSLKFMRRTYQDASHVLVLDQELEPLDTNVVQPAELFIRILMSGWITRLWTYQEAVLPDKLWFQFRDRALEWEQLNGLVSKRAKDSYGTRLLLWDIQVMSSNLRLKQRGSVGQDLSSTPGGMDLAIVSEGLYRRSVTVPSDEALCLCTLLDLDVSAVLEAGHTAPERMQMVWKLIGEKYHTLPQSIIGFRFPKIDLPGSRWAPLSLLRETSPETIGRYARWLSGQPAEVSDEGLKVCSSGLKVGMHSTTRSAVRRHEKAFGPAQNLQYVFRDHLGVFRHVTLSEDGLATPTTLLEALQSAELAIFPSGQLGMSFKLMGMEMWEGTIGGVTFAAETGLIFSGKWTAKVRGVFPPEKALFDISQTIATDLDATYQQAMDQLIAHDDDDEDVQKLERFQACAREFYDKVQECAETWVTDPMLVACCQGPWAVYLNPGLIREFVFLRLAYGFHCEVLPQEQVWYLD